MGKAQQVEWAIQQGIKEAKRHLGAIADDPTMQDIILRGYAAGIAQGVGEYLANRYHRRHAFNLFSQLAEDVIAPDLPKGK